MGAPLSSVTSPVILAGSTPWALNSEPGKARRAAAASSHRKPKLLFIVVTSSVRIRRSQLRLSELWIIAENNGPNQKKKIGAGMEIP
jgi:hypothetical protein